VCAVLLLPGWVELLENLEHLVHDGHLPHGELHEAEGAGEDHAVESAEHGCTPVSHHCGCHVSIPAILAADAALPHRVLVFSRTTPPTTDDRPASRANAPPTRPPIA